MRVCFALTLIKILVLLMFQSCRDGQKEKIHMCVETKHVLQISKYNCIKKRGNNAMLVKL